MKQRIPNTTTNTGLHEFVANRVLAKYARPGIRAADLGSGPGAMAARLRSFGCDLLAVDRNAEGFEADFPHAELNFDQNDFASELGLASFDLVTAIEVIEHVESPIGFLRNIGRMLAPQGNYDTKTSIRSPRVQSFCSLGKSAQWTSLANRRTFLPFSGICCVTNCSRGLPCACASISSFLFPLSSKRLPTLAQTRHLDVSHPRRSILR
jgi:SAM-dependent methyltransferase